MPDVTLQLRPFAVQCRPSGRHERWVIKVEDGLSMFAAMLTVVNRQLQGFPDLTLDLHVISDVHIASSAVADDSFVGKFGGPWKLWIPIVSRESSGAFAAIA